MFSYNIEALAPTLLHAKLKINHPWKFKKWRNKEAYKLNHIVTFAFYHLFNVKTFLSQSPLSK